MILSLIDYYELQEWEKANPELDSLISLVIHYDTLFLFVLIIGIYEMLTKPSWFKNLIRILLVGIIFGYQISGLVSIGGFKFGVYNTAWFSAIIAFILILFVVVKHMDDKHNRKNLNKDSR